MAAQQASAPAPAARPTHVALIMDGNRRWAETRGRSREAGYRAGLERARQLIPHAIERGVRALTLFAFSRENRRRAPDEVALLMRLFAEALDRRAGELLAQGTQLRFIGELGRLSAATRARIGRIEARAPAAPRLTVCVAVHYGGRQDLLQAFARCRGGAADEAAVSAALGTGGLPDPDLLIRTGGERRLSNFLLWQVAYTELYFTDCLWPDFDAAAFDAALDWYARRERRFGGDAAEVA